MNRRHIHEAFDSYRRAAISGGEAPESIDKAKQHFYAGAWALFNVVMQGLTPGPDSTPADEQFLADIDAELREYGRSKGARV